MVSSSGLIFSTKKGNQYLYDDCTGLVFPYPNKDSTRSFGQRKENKFQNEFDLKLNDYLPLSKFPNSCLEISETSVKKHIFTEGFRQLILHLTNECNLRCRYCVHSGEYPYHSGYSDEAMSFDNAKRGIDYYFWGLEQVRKKNPFKKPTVSFYGGEPLLEFELIKQCIEYIKERYYPVFGKPIFTISTNGTLLNEEKAEYLIKNEVGLAISLDGPREEHDRNRVFVDGRGSFNTIMKNFEKIEKKYPEILKQSLALITLDYGTDLSKVSDFFNKSSTIPQMCRVSFVSTSFSDYYHRFNEKDRLKIVNQILDLEKIYSKKILEKDLSGFSVGLFGNSDFCHFIRPVLGRARNSLMPFTGSCVPGEKISVHPDGTIHMCERINAHFPIGNVREGLDFKYIADITTLYNQQITSECSGCSIQRLCTLCFAQCAANGEFKKPEDNVCENIKMHLTKQMSRIYSIVEDDQSAFEQLAEGYYYQNIGKWSQLMEGVL